MKTTFKFTALVAITLTLMPEAYANQHARQLMVSHCGAVENATYVGDKGVAGEKVICTGGPNKGKVVVITAEAEVTKPGVQIAGDTDNDPDPIGSTFTTGSVANSGDPSGDIQASPIARSGTADSTVAGANADQFEIRLGVSPRESNYFGSEPLNLNLGTGAFDPSLDPALGFNPNGGLGFNPNGFGDGADTFGNTGNIDFLGSDPLRLGVQPGLTFGTDGSTDGTGIRSRNPASGTQARVDGTNPGPQLNEAEQARMAILERKHAIEQHVVSGNMTREEADAALRQIDIDSEKAGLVSAAGARQQSIDSSVAAAATPGGGDYKAGGKMEGELLGCFPEIQTPQLNCASACVGDDCKDGVYQPLERTVVFNSPISCKQYFGEGDIRSKPNLKSKICRVVSSACKQPNLPDGATEQQKNSAKVAYQGCLLKSEQTIGRSVIVGAQKCAAIHLAAQATDAGQEQGKAGGSPITCKTNGTYDGYAFDYKGCTSFLNWYMGLQATEAGLGIYNEADKTMTGMKAQNDMAQEIQKGNGQTAGLDGAKRTTMAAADAESRNKLFFASKGAAITAQLMMFTTESSIQDECSNGAACCKLFSANGDDKVKGDFFPNKGARDHMIAEVIKAGGAAVAAALKEAELKKQAALMQAAKEQLAGPEDESEEGFMKFCQQYPQDVRCLGPGNRLSVGNNGYGSNFQGQNFGLGDLGSATTDEFNTETIAPGSGPGTAAAAVGGIGNMNKDAAQAKDIFNAPPAARGGGAPAAGGGAGGGGAGASASANGLSNDPGVQAEKTEDPLKVTSKKANYDGAAGYSGGSWQPGAAKKEGGAENPFAAMFNKNKGRDIAAAKEIDSPASDLFTKISNRYGEVQKRKGLMEATDTNIR